MEFLANRRLNFKSVVALQCARPKYWSEIRRFLRKRNSWRVCRISITVHREARTSQATSHYPFKNEHRVICSSKIRPNCDGTSIAPNPTMPRDLDPFPQKKNNNKRYNVLLLSILASWQPNFISWQQSENVFLPLLRYIPTADKRIISNTIFEIN